MDYMKIIQKDGYRVDDLDETHQAAIRAMWWLREDLADGFSYQSEDEPDTIIGRMKREVAADVFEQVLTYIDIDIADHQISFAESGPDA